MPLIYSGIRELAEYLPYVSPRKNRVSVRRKINAPHSQEVPALWKESRCFTTNQRAANRVVDHRRFDVRGIGALCRLARSRWMTIFLQSVLLPLLALDEFDVVNKPFLRFIKVNAVHSNHKMNGLLFPFIVHIGKVVSKGNAVDFSIA